MDYKEEQNSEMEALESIYCGELEVLTRDPFRFCVRVKSEQHEDETGDGLACTLKITFPDKYPEELPILEVIDADNFEEGLDEELLSYLLTQSEENLGMAVVFTLVSATQEWLNCKWDKVKEDREEEAERRVKQAEEEELKRFEGTRVTVESFLAWKKSFEDEIGLTKQKEIQEKEGKKLTGRELFLQDQTLIESDLKFLEEGEAVKVDESLFQELDELDLEDNELSDD